jgi:hypothetical protein
MTNEIMVKDGFMYGQWRKAINAAAGLGAGSIHDDATGKKVGMRGGVVAGTVHHDLFPPLILRAFSQRWFEQGSISIFYTYALLHGEELRAIMKVPPVGAKDVQVEARLESLDGHKVGEGTVSMGNPGIKTHLEAMELTSSPKDERRILKDLDVGWEMPPVDCIVKHEDLKNRLSNLEDTIDWYIDKSPWGLAIVPPSGVVGLLRLRPPWEVKGVGFFGANEVRYVNGPVKVDTPYIAKGKVIAIGVTNKTEYYWHDSQLFEKTTNKLVATMRLMLRFMKAGSPLYPEL